jgi:dCTP deaminase
MADPEGCTWTLEMSAIQPLRIYAGVRIGQLTFMTLEGEQTSYKGRYTKQDGPVPSRLWKDFLPEAGK